MSQLPFNSTADKGETLVCRLTPGGHINVQSGLPEDGPPLTTRTARQIIEAFSNGRGRGILHLGAAQLSTDLPPSLSCWRDLGRSFISRVCGAIDPTNPKSLVIPDPDPDEISTFLQSVPPMQGAEFVSIELLGDVWSDMGTAISVEVQGYNDGVQGYLKKHSSVWNVVGRVCFHLAENKRDPDFPFAFIATYIHRVSRQAKPQHLPLGRALKDYAGTKNRQKLLALLAPLSRAAEQSKFICELVNEGEIYHPLSWKPEEAHRFLSEVALYEQAGLIVRMPDWWSVKNKPRPKVSVKIGGKTPSVLGMDALLDFEVGLTLDGKKLSNREIEELLASTHGLVLIKGKWIEVDRDKLSQVLEQWREVQRQAQSEGVSFSEAMRMLSGIQLNGDEAIENMRPEWSEVIAGKWLSSRLDALRSPDLQADIQANARLRSYQKLGVQWLSTLRGLELGGCLADDMGLGKTIQVLGLLSMSPRKQEKGTDLLIVPASLVDNWRLEIERFASKLKVLIAHPSHIPSPELKKLEARRVDAHDAVITTYGTAMRTPWIKEYAWRSIILDEAQAIKNPASKQTRAVKAMKSKWRLALTGTPVENRLGDLWSIFDFLNPGLLGPAKAFSRLCKSMAQSTAKGKQGAYTPLRRLIAPYILRRLKTDKNVITDLPDKTEVTAHCLLSKRQAALYKQSVDEMQSAIDKLNGIERRGVVLAFLMRFKQICNHPSQWLGDGAYEPADSGKLSRLRELCESIAARQDKVLVFTQFREMTGPLASFLAKVFGYSGAVLHGGTPVKKRQALVKSFQEDDYVPFMVLSLKAGGTGLNLTAASHVIHFDRWWNPAVENQATDRAFRIGQKKNVLVHKFVCQGTLEERIDQLIADKQKLSDEVLSRGAESSLTEMSNEELISMVSLDLSSAMEG